MSKLSDFEGKTLKEIEDALPDCITALALRDEGMWGSMLGTAFREQGAAVCACYVAALMFAQNRNMVHSFTEGFALIRDAADKLESKKDKKKAKIADKLKCSVHNMDCWLAYSSDHIRATRENREKIWPIKLNKKELSPAQLIALGIAVVFLTGLMAQAPDSEWQMSNVNCIIHSCATRHAKEVLECCSIRKGKKK